MPEETPTPDKRSGEPFGLKDIDKAPDTVKSSVGPKSSEEFNKDVFEALRVVSDEKVKLQEEIIKLKEKVHTSETLDKLIHPYAAKAYWFMVAYASFVGFMILLDAISIGRFHIDTDILKILIGSTAANVIGLVGMVLTGVFVGARKRG